MKYQQHELATQSRQMVPFILKIVLSLVLNDISEPGIHHIQQLSPVRENNLPSYFL